jgi:predicted Zn-ribbon and HTH transcriptional regulator
MAIRKIMVIQYICERCDHKWHPRQNELPTICPKCKSAYWDKPRREKK